MGKGQEKICFARELAMTDRELMQQALDALMAADPDDMVFDAEGHMVFRKDVAINALRDRLAQPEQEPVAWYDKHGMVTHDPFEGIRPLCAAPRPWVGLTDDEIKEIIGPWGDTPIKGYTRKLFDQIEAKLKEKNT
jgi:hypothetical protein